MERMKSKLTAAFVVLLLLAAAVTIANSQEQPKTSFIYAIDSAGAMKWSRHDGAVTGAATWQGKKNVGSGWEAYGRVFPGGANIIYGITSDGLLKWHQHQGFRIGTGPENDPQAWADTKTVGSGWGDFKDVFSSGQGQVYAVKPDGTLLLYQQIGWETGEPSWQAARQVGTGWADFRQIVPMGDGVILAITNDGKLLWYKHLGLQRIANSRLARIKEVWEGPKEVGHGWGFKNVFSSGDGIIYAITEDGKLQWRKYNGYMTGGGYDTWQGPTEVGTGWGDFVQVFAVLTSSSTPPVERPRTSDADQDLSSRGGPLERKPDPGRARAAFQPENTIKVSVKYKKEFGYLGDSNAFGYVGPTSCSAFSVSVAVGDGSAGQKNPFRISSDSKMEETDGYYFCSYLVSEIPLNQPIRVSVGLAGVNQFAAWKGGSQAQPPPGQQRTIIIVSGREGGPLTLTATQPRARQLFEMVYTSQPR